MKSILHQYPEATVATQLHLFDTLVLPVLNYGSEIWGFSEADKLEKLYLNFLKNVLSVRNSTPSAFVYKELKVLPLITHRLIRIFKFWLKVISLPDSCLVKYVYNVLMKDVDAVGTVTNWAILVKRMLENHGLGFIWNQQNVINRNDTYYISFFTQRINDTYLQKLNSDINNVSNTRLYKHINTYEVNNNYLNQIQEKYIRTALSKLRLGSHNLMIERGRWMKLEVVDRECFTCGKLDDELHCITECSLYIKWRKQFLPKWLYTNPSMHKLVHFLDYVNGKELRNFGIFCHKVINYIQNSII